MRNKEFCKPEIKINLFQGEEVLMSASVNEEKLDEFQNYIITRDAQQQIIKLTDILKYSD